MTKVVKQVSKGRSMNHERRADAPLRIVPVKDSGGVMIPTGIDALNRRLGGLEPGGVYLVSGTPGPAKLVSALQFLHVGLSRGERALLLTGVEAPGLLEVARAWGSRLDRAWEHGDLEIIGFRDDFELRVLRSTEPQDALEELARLVPEDVTRIAVDPGSMFLQTGGRSLLGRAFLDWARHHPATVWITLSVDNEESLPSSAEWLLHATDGVFMLDRLPGGLYQILVQRSLPDVDDSDDPATLRLIPGVGLTEPEEAPSRRSTDRPVGDPDHLLVVSLGDALSPDLQTWAERRFSTEIVTDPLEAVTRLQGGYKPGSVLVLSSRQELKAALQTCRALRPLTGAAVVFASDDAIRSTDRVGLLDAGADDCLSGGIDVRELETRIEQSAAVGGKPPSSVQLVDESEGDLLGGVKDPGTFRRSNHPYLHGVLGSASGRPGRVGQVLRLTVPNDDYGPCGYRRGP